MSRGVVFLIILNYVLKLKDFFIKYKNVDSVIQDKLLGQ